MKKNNLILILSLIFGLIVVFGISIYFQLNNKLEKHKIESKVLSELKVTNLHGKEVQKLKNINNQSFVIVYFNSACESCTNLIENILDSINYFGETKVFLISSQELEDLDSYSTKLDLVEYPNIDMFFSSDLDIYQCFGEIITPTIFIYDKNKKQKKRFVGNIMIHNIINAI